MVSLETLFRNSLFLLRNKFFPNKVRFFQALFFHVLFYKICPIEGAVTFLCNAVVGPDKIRVMARVAC